jgi:GT2 family glycosyltransferase
VRDGVSISRACVDLKRLIFFALAMVLEGLTAVTVTFNPHLGDRRLETQIRQLRNEAILHVVVDNGSSNLADLAGLVEQEAKAGSRVQLVSLGSNRGIGHALNEGVRLCRELPPTQWVLTLDQDTVFAPDAFSSLAREIADIPNPERAGIIALNYTEHRFNRTRPYNRAPGPARAKSVITSGSLVNRRVFESVAFDEGLFLYFVDVDFCHRVRRLGFPIFVLREAFIDHQEGSVVERSGRQYFYLEPPRLYFVCRNSIVIFRRYASVKALLVAGYLVGMNLLGASSRRQTLGYVWAGFRAALRPDPHPPSPASASP